MYYILKNFYPGSNIWVVQLSPDDPIYSYETLEAAEAALPEVQALYPDNLCRVSDPLTDTI